MSHAPLKKRTVPANEPSNQGSLLLVPLTNTCTHSLTHLTHLCLSHSCLALRYHYQQQKDSFPRSLARSLTPFFSFLLDQILTCFRWAFFLCVSLPLSLSLCFCASPQICVNSHWTPYLHRRTSSFSSIPCDFACCLLEMLSIHYSAPDPRRQPKIQLVPPLSLLFHTECSLPHCLLLFVE